MVFHWAFRLCGPIGQLVTASWYVGAASTMAIKIAGGSLRRPPPSFIIMIVLPQSVHALALFLCPAFQ
jgi:hypothetical protein